MLFDHKKIKQELETLAKELGRTAGRLRRNLQVLLLFSKTISKKRPDKV